MKAILKFLAASFAALALVCSFVAAEAADLREVKITLYDTAKGGASPVAVGRAPLLPRETKAKLYAVSKAPQMAALPYTRDEFFVTLLSLNRGTGRASFRVRYQRIENKICTAMEIKDYSEIPTGGTVELTSPRGKIRAVIKAE